MKYKHYSFDLWLTLIKSNPVFKQERNQYFYEKFNRDKLSIEKVSEIVRDVDVTCNSVNEMAEGHITPFQMYVMILNRLNYPIHNLSGMDMVAIYHYIEGIFLKHPPTAYSEETFPTLLKLKEKGATISLLSNTGFILGQTINKMFDQHFKIHVPGMSVNNIFSFKLYSDEMRVSKPHPAAYQNALTMIMAVLARPKTPIIQKNEICHVGDNAFADEAGAKKYGFDTYLINSNNQLIQDLLK